jgi:hypothetical protein
VPLVAAPGSGSRWGGQALQIRVRAGCGGAWLASVTVGVYEAVSIVGVTVRAGYRDLGVDGRSIPPGQSPGSDRPDGNFRASNQDQMVRMLVHTVHHDA